MTGVREIQRQPCCRKATAAWVMTRKGCAFWIHPWITTCRQLGQLESFLFPAIVTAGITLRAVGIVASSKFQELYGTCKLWVLPEPKWTVLKRSRYTALEEPQSLSLSICVVWKKPIHVMEDFIQKSTHWSVNHIKSHTFIDHNVYTGIRNNWLYHTYADM